MLASTELISVDTNETGNKYFKYPLGKLKTGKTSHSRKKNLNNSCHKYFFQRFNSQFMFFSIQL